MADPKPQRLQADKLHDLESQIGADEYERRMGETAKTIAKAKPPAAPKTK